MALASASAVIPTPVANNANSAPQTAVPGAANAAKFSETLEAVLQSNSAQTPATGNSGKVDPFTIGDAAGKIVKLKNKTKSPDVDAAALMQAPAQKIMDGNAVLRGIDMNALRAALAQQETASSDANAQLRSSGATGAGTTAPKPGATRISAASAQAPIAHGHFPGSGIRNPGADTKIPDPAEHTQPVVPANGGSSASPTALPHATAATVQPGSAPSSAKSPSLETQARLAEALVKIANATPAANTSAAAPSVAKMTAALKASSAKPNSPKTATTLPTDAAQMAAGTKSAPAAQGRAKAGADPKTASSSTTITKIEMAAMTTASQEAVKTPAPQAKIEAQALPVNFDTAAKSAGDKDTGAQTDGKNGKSGSERNAAAQPTDASAMKIADAPLPQNSPAHATPAPSTNLNAAGTGVSAPSAAAPAQNTVTLQVAPQAQHNAPSDQPNLAALGVSIAAKSKDGEKQFDITMHPADLGRVQVRLSVDSDGKAQAHLVAEKPQTLQLLQNDRTTLERSLKDAGLDLSNNGLNFSLKGEQQPSTPTFNARSRALSVAAVPVIDTSSFVSSHAGIASGDSRLDIRV